MANSQANVHSKEDLAWMSRPIKKVAIVGGGPTRIYAPFKDKTWEIWSLGRVRLFLPRVNRWFEMHSIPQLKAYRGNPRTKRLFPEYWRYLKRLKCPVYMQRRHRKIPNSVRYPLRKVRKSVGRCFTSSVSYMIALAIVEGYEGIGLWGVDMRSKEEYIYQRASVRYLLALAKKRGIYVYLPPSCPITVPDKPVYYRAKHLYGYDWDAPDAWWNRLKRKRLRLRRARRRRMRRHRRMSRRLGRTRRSRIRSRRRLRPVRRLRR